MIGRIPISRYLPIHYMGLLRPALRSAQLSPLAERRLKHGTEDSGEESSDKARTRLRQVKTIQVRQGFCGRKNPAGDGAATSGLMTEYVGHDKQEAIMDTKEEETRNEAKVEPMSEAKNEPVSEAVTEAKEEAFSEEKQEPIRETNDSPNSDVKDEPFTTEIPQERRQESPFESRPELPMEGQPATPTQPSPQQPNPKNPYHIVTCQQDHQDSPPSNAEASEGKVKVSGTIMFKESSHFNTNSLHILENEATKKGESMNVWAQSFGSEATSSDVMEPAKKDNVDSAAKEEKTQIILDFETQASTNTEGNIDIKVNSSTADDSLSSENKNELSEGTQAKIEEVYQTTPKGYEIGCVVDFSGIVQRPKDSAVKAEQAVEAIVPETTNLEDKLQTSSTAENEEQAVKDVEEVETIVPENPEQTAFKSPTNNLTIRIVRNEDGSPVHPVITTRIPSSELKSDRDAPPEEDSSLKRDSKRKVEFIQTQPVLTSDGEMKLLVPTSEDLSPEQSLQKATEIKQETNELQSEKTELQLEMKKLYLEATQQKSEAKTIESESKELQSEMKELESEATELKSEMKELEAEATEQKSESTDAVSASQTGAQNTPKSAAEIISMLEHKHKAKKSMSFDLPIKSTSQIVQTFGLRPEPGQGFRAKGTLNRTELDRQADEYFAKINEPETLQLEKKREEETAHMESKMQLETSQLENKLEAELEKTKMGPESSTLEMNVEPDNSQLDRKVEQVETAEESNRKAEAYFETIAELETSQLDNKLEEEQSLEESKASAFEEMSKADEYSAKINPELETSQLDSNVEPEVSKIDREMEPKVPKWMRNVEVQNPHEPKEYAAFKAMVQDRKADEYFAKINEAEMSQLDGKIEPESSQWDTKMEPKTAKKQRKILLSPDTTKEGTPENAKSFEEKSTSFILTRRGEKEQADDTDLNETSMEMKLDDAIADQKVEETKDEPSDRPLFVPPDDKDRLKEKSLMSEGDLYKPQSEDPMADDVADYDSKPSPTKPTSKEEKPRSKPKLEDGELDIKLLVRDEKAETAAGTPKTTAASDKQNFVQYIVGKIFRKGRKTSPTNRKMSTYCQRRDLNKSSTLLCPEDNDIFDDPYSPEEGKIINPDDNDFISPDLKRQGLGARAIREDREANGEYGQPQAMNKDTPKGVWSINKSKTPLSPQPSVNMSTAIPMLQFSSDNKDPLKILGGSAKCKNREKTIREQLMEKKEDKDNKIEILGGSEQCAEKLKKLKKSPKDDDCKSSFSSYFEGFTKMFWSSSVSEAEPPKKEK
ncbi:myosin-9 [Drosophila obscura]|uniref:myosin-9 n=1 Tax=Drosophila obscura TaxID=7282 RepID=UPI001BB1B0BA|nr:myosin-9 [Drosophila obscura]